MPLQTGQTLNNRYRIVKLLGQGGFGAVYRAWDANLNKPVAVKENLQVSPEATGQFAREANVLANLSHTNLPRVTDHFTIQGQGQYLVMDFVEGEDMDTLMQQQGRLPPGQAMQWINQVLDALVYLHGRSPAVIHRDIKPANIRITPDGRAMLVDFGLVKVSDPGLRTTLGARAVTPCFSPPEQYGQGRTDARSDIYALGATLYTLLTGTLPPESVQRSLSDSLRPPHLINPQVPMDMSHAILRAMSLNPAQRFQNAADFKAALGQPSTPIPGTLKVSPPQAYNPTQVVPLARQSTPPQQYPQSYPPPPQYPQAQQQPASAPKFTPVQQAAPAYVRPAAVAPAIAPPMARQKSKLPAFAGVGVGIAVIICLGLVLVLGGGAIKNQRAVATVHSRETSVAKEQTKEVAIEQTATAGVEQTATAEVVMQATAAERERSAAQETASAQQTAEVVQQATSTAQAQINYMEKIKSSRAWVYGPQSGSLPHEADNLIEGFNADLKLKNFMAEAIFFNPFGTDKGTWDYGFLFRHEGTNKQFRLAIRSTGTYELLNNTGEADGESISNGNIPNLNTDEGGWNRIVLIVQGKQGKLYVNDVFITDLDLSKRTNAGDIWLVTGIYNGDEIVGYSTGYQDYQIWSLP